MFDKYEVGCLAWGDYGLWIGDKQVPIVFERKGLGDLYGTMTSGYSRFKEEMKRCKDAGHHMVLAIEGTVQDVWQGYEHSQYSGEAMLKKLGMLRVRHDIEVQFFDSRRAMARWIEEVFAAVARNWANTPTTKD